MSANYTIKDLLPLPNSSVRIPRFGFGVYRSPTTQCVDSCLNALKAGYRHIDTAQFYANEQQVGEAIHKSGIPRSDIFVTSKILSPAGSHEATYNKLLASVEKIDGLNGYVDLFLIHSHSCGANGRKELWQALERLLAEGKTRSIGVSNFGVKHIEEMRQYARVWPPHVNQIEVGFDIFVPLVSFFFLSCPVVLATDIYDNLLQLHPWCQQRVINDYCRKNGIVVESYAPIVRNYKSSNPTLVELAEKYGKSTQQVLIRYALQKEWVPLPKSDNPSRIVSNAEIFDFNISDDDMAVLNDLDQGKAGAVVQAVEN